jgi:hypothetical protein
MKKISYYQFWLEQTLERLEIKKDRFGLLDGYPGIVKSEEKKGGPLVNWHQLMMPEGPCETNLDYAIKIGCVDVTHEYFKLFLNWANEAADRALVDERFNIDQEAERLNGNLNWKAMKGWRNEISYPGNHGKVLAVAAFARALRDDSELDEAVVLQAIAEIAESVMAGGTKFWDAISQTNYLRSVRLALCVGCVDKAEALLKSNRRKFKWTYQHHEWLEWLCKLISKSDGAWMSEDVQKFQEYFDLVRDPRIQGLSESDGWQLMMNISILRLELAVLKQRYVLRQNCAGNWHSILKLISE